MSTPYPLAVLLALVAGCASGGDSTSLEGAPIDSSGSSTTSGLAQQIRVDVYPSELLDAFGEVRALPTTKGPFSVPADVLRDVNVRLGLPGLLSGVVTGHSVTPTGDGATLPAIVDVVAADVFVLRPQTVQNYGVRTVDGEYAAHLVAPQDDYLVAVVPDDPLLPFETREVRVDSSGGVQDFDLGAGVGLYGQITTAGAPLANASVFITDGYGTQSQPVLTDEDGWYNTRVLPDRSYMVTSTGRSSGRDPTIESSLTFVEGDGSRVDLNYPNLVGSFAFGRVVDAKGQGLSGITVRFVAKTLDGYEDITSALAVEDITDSSGNFEARLMNGLYRVEVQPPQTDDPSADHAAMTLTEGVAVSGGADVGTLTLANLVTSSGEVHDGAGGNPVSNAKLVCTELGIDGRSWSAFTNKQGRYELQLPPTALSCQIIPPGDRLDLAWTTEQVDMGIDNGHIFEFRTGRRILGDVSFGQLPESFAVVEIRDGLGALLGTTITNDAGQFDIQVDLPEE